jgi:ketosteroid isomerase-like protein
VFYPRGIPARATGRAEFEKGFAQVFEQIRDGKKAAPFMQIETRRLEIQRAGDIAVVTFELDDRPGMLNRRTLVWKKTGQGWKIIHLHASEVKLPPN